MELVRHAFDAWITEQEDAGVTPDVNTHVLGSPSAVTPAVLTQEEEEDMDDDDDMEGQEGFCTFHPWAVETPRQSGNSIFDLI